MKTSVKQNSAFTLIEMIGVLAIIGILAAVVAPRVIESIRDAKVTSAVASVGAAKTAAIGYYQRYDNFPLDTETVNAGVLDYKSDPSDPLAYTPAVGGLDFGDVLVRQSQLLEQEKTPIGRPDDEAVHAIGCASVGDTLIGGATYTGTSTKIRFKSAGFGTRIVYYFMPNLTLQEAAALAAKVNGPFTSDAVSDQDFVNASIAGSGLAAAGGLEGANAWFVAGSNNGDYHAYVYVAHQ
jgi:prepilin-type N-terminal cleavage/methylation domain-containing protein